MDPGFDGIRRAYEGLEAAATFTTPAALEDYREAMLRRSAAQAAMIAPSVTEGPVLEIGSGSGRLLIALAGAGVDTATGLDLSASRTDFARAWARDRGLAGLRFEAGDVLERDLPAEHFGAAVCVTGALGYFAPAAHGSDERLLEQLAGALRPGGALWLELYPHASTRRLLALAGGKLRQWLELPEPDPWRFYLSDYTLDAATETLTHRKTFVARAGGALDEGRQERLRLFDPESLGGLIAATGRFEDVELFGEWDGSPYAGGDLLIARARRA